MVCFCVQKGKTIHTKYIKDVGFRDQLEKALMAAGAQKLASCASAKMDVSFVAGGAPFTNKLHNYMSDTCRVYHFDVVNFDENTINHTVRVQGREVAPLVGTKKIEAQVTSPKITTEQRSLFTERLIQTAEGAPLWGTPLQKSPGLGQVNSPLIDCGSLYAAVCNSPITPDDFVKLAGLVCRRDVEYSLAEQVAMLLIQRAGELSSIRLATDPVFASRVAGADSELAMQPHFQGLLDAITTKQTVHTQTLLLLHRGGIQDATSLPPDSSESESSEESDQSASPPAQLFEENNQDGECGAGVEAEGEAEGESRVSAISLHGRLESLWSQDDVSGVLQEFLESEASDEENQSDTLFDPFSILRQYLTATSTATASNPTTTTTTTTTTASTTTPTTTPTTTTTTTATTATTHIAETILADVLLEPWVAGSCLNGRLGFLENKNSARRLVLLSFVCCFFRVLVGVFWACSLKTSNPKHQSQLLATSVNLFLRSTDLKDCLLVCLSNINSAPTTRNFFIHMNTLAQSILAQTNRAFCNEIAGCRKDLL